ncbi:hypothetical protein A2U01_0111060, partial [Trifolium medium]|nr:hypothetical protein [Trifolium medium]
MNYIRNPFDIPGYSDELSVEQPFDLCFDLLHHHRCEPSWILLDWFLPGLQ